MLRVEGRVAEKCQISVRHVSRALRPCARLGALRRRGYVRAWGKRLAAYKTVYSTLKRWVPEAVKSRCAP